MKKWIAGSIMSLALALAVAGPVSAQGSGTFKYAESATVLGELDLIVFAGHRGDFERFARIET